MTDNPLPSHNNGPAIVMISDDRDYDPTYKTIITIATPKDKSKMIAKSEKKGNSGPSKFWNKNIINVGGKVSAICIEGI